MELLTKVPVGCSLAFHNADAATVTAGHESELETVKTIADQ
ncbi:DUF2853 family protein [Ruegeria sp. ANG-S4]